MAFRFIFFGRKEKSSSSVAKDRLLEVLIHDRIKLPPATMEQIRNEILAVLSKYIDVDPEGVEFTLTRSEGTDQLKANIPLRRGEARSRFEADGEDEDLTAVPRPAGSGGAPASASLSGGSSRPTRVPAIDPRAFGPPRKKRR